MFPSFLYVCSAYKIKFYVIILKCFQAFLYVFSAYKFISSRKYNTTRSVMSEEIKKMIELIDEIDVSYLFYGF
jgi:ABC-type Zn uptake system ZnuABC Zn-binding protein ZnuA